MFHNQCLCPSIVVNMSVHWIFSIELHFAELPYLDKDLRQHLEKGM